MKKIILLAILLLAIVPIASAETTLTTSLIKYEPLPAQPGQYVTVFVEIQNTGNEDAPNAIIEIPNQFPFTATDSSRKEIGTLKSQQSYVIDFKLRVDSQAVVGDNSLTIRYTPDSSQNLWKEDKHNIRVQPTGASLAVTDIKMSPAEVAPGDEATIQITVKNTADIVLRDISLQLGMITISGSSAVDLPFIPTNSITEKRITRLAPDKQTILTYTLKAYPSATPGYYKLPLSISFYDEEGTQTEQSDYIGVVIKAVPELKTYVEDSSTLKKDQDGTVTLKFVNKGVSDLKFLDVTLLPSEDYEIKGNAETYVGDVDSDDYRSETFSLKPNKDAITLQVSFEYKDSNNVAYTNIQEIPLQATSTDKNSNQKTSPIIIVVIVVVVLGIIVFSRRQKHKRKK